MQKYQMLNATLATRVALAQNGDKRQPWLHDMTNKLRRKLSATLHATPVVPPMRDPLLQAQLPRFCALLVKEAFKTWGDAVSSRRIYCIQRYGFRTDRF